MPAYIRKKILNNLYKSRSLLNPWRFREEREGEETEREPRSETRNESSTILIKCIMYTYTIWAYSQLFILF